MAILGFQPQYRLTGQPTWTNAGAELPPTTTSYTFSGLVPGDSYDMRILEISTTGSAASNIVTNATVAGESLQGTTITSAGPIINASTTPGTAAPANGPFNTFSISGGQVIPEWWGRYSRSDYRRHWTILLQPHDVRGGNRRQLVRRSRLVARRWNAR